MVMVAAMVSGAAHIAAIGPNVAATSNQQCKRK
jgi:hypothetical protein